MILLSKSALEYVLEEGEYKREVKKMRREGISRRTGGGGRFGAKRQQNHLSLL
jgi:hypothetical protein